MLKLRMLDRTVTSGDKAKKISENLVNEHSDSESRILDENSGSFSKSDGLILEKTMIWTELEACKRQVNQIGVSACGATALINVLQVSGFPILQGCIF